MRRHMIYAVKLMNNPAQEPSALGEVLAPNKKQAVWAGYREFAHLLSMYDKTSLFSIRL